MKFKIVYDNCNRLRVRTGNYTFTQEESFGIDDKLLEKEFIFTAETNFRTGSILVTYQDGRKQDVLNLISSFDKKSLPKSEVSLTVKADEKFRDDIMKMVGRKLISKAIPFSLRKYICN